MQEQTPITTEQVHGNLTNLLLNGRILVNGLPLTANEIASVIQGEKMLFEKAMKLDQAVALAAKKQAEEEAKKLISASKLEENNLKLVENTPEKS